MEISIPLHRYNSHAQHSTPAFTHGCGPCDDGRAGQTHPCGGGGPNDPARKLDTAEGVSVGEMISDERGKVGTQGGRNLLLITTPFGRVGWQRPTFFLMMLMS